MFTEELPHPSEDPIRKCRRLLKQRSKLAAEDQQWLDANQDAVEAQVKAQFDALTLADRQQIAAMYGRLDLHKALTELAMVQPALRSFEDPRAASEQIVGLDGLDGVAFDTARDALTTLAYIDSHLSLWKAWWREYGLAPSEDRAESQVKLLVWDVCDMRAKLQPFEVFYTMTQGRVARTYEKLSRCLTGEIDGYKRAVGGAQLREFGV